MASGWGFIIDVRSLNPAPVAQRHRWNTRTVVHVAACTCPRCHNNFKFNYTTLRPLHYWVCVRNGTLWTCTVYSSHIVMLCKVYHGRAWTASTNGVIKLPMKLWTVCKFVFMASSNCSRTSVIFTFSVGRLRIRPNWFQSTYLLSI